MKFILIFILFIGHISASECSHLLDDCEYYVCVEKQKKCGKRKYPMGFGHKYCQKFTKKLHKFSAQGQIWVEEAKNCLIEKLDTLDEDISCRKFKRKATKQHVPCYIEAGYCNLPKSDRKLITKTVIKSMWRPSLVWAGLKVLNKCRN